MGQRDGVPMPRRAQVLAFIFPWAQASHGAKTTKLEERDIALRGKTPSIKKI
jgi:hypothetical protein